MRWRACRQTNEQAGIADNAESTHAKAIQVDVRQRMLRGVHGGKTHRPTLCAASEGCELFVKKQEVARG